MQRLMASDRVLHRTSDSLGGASLVRRIRDVARYLPRKGWILCALALAQVPALLSPVLTGKVVDTLAKGSAEATVLACLLTALLIVFVVGSSFRYCFDRQLAASLLEFEKRLRLRLWDSFERISLGEYESTPHGVFHAKMSRDIPILSMTIQTITEAVLVSLIIGTGAIVMTLYWQPWFLLVVAAALTVNGGIYWLFQDRIAKVTHAAHDSNENLHRLGFDLIEMVPLFRVFSVMDRYRALFLENIDGNIRANLKLNQVNIRFGTAIGAIAESGRYSVLAVAVAMCLFHKITLGDVVLYQSLFSQALDGMCRIVFLLPRIEMGRESLHSIHPMLVLSESGRQKPEGAKRTVDGAIELQNVHFSYPGKESKALSGAACTIAPGEHVVILGKNGSGKSTLARLLLGYYAPDLGAILIDGVPNNLVSADAIAAKIAFVPQAARLYRDSLLENIRLRDVSLSPEIVMEAARKCNLTRLLSRFSEGIHETITPESLSGGETQCVAIARALVRNPSVLLLDEITSHLDIYSKKMIFNVLRDLHESCTIITITHDMEFIGLADRALIMDEGQLYDVDIDSPPESISEILDSIRQVAPVT